MGSSVGVERVPSNFCMDARRTRRKGALVLESSAMPSQAFVIARCISLFSPTTLVVLVVVRALGMLLATTHQ